ncbi:MAG: hypothetical protein EP347_03705 [Alphaproteobacteria bacterium]|nr:MAG: hypothetical protein EP347_03705 [Alphaproteobacteria bacterium]
MAYQDQRPERQPVTSLPSRAGDARHTLVSGPLAEMSKLLAQHSPACTSTALTLLRTNFPHLSLEQHKQALRIYRERLSDSNQ